MQRAVSCGCTLPDGPSCFRAILVVWSGDVQSPRRVPDDPGYQVSVRHGATGIVMESSGRMLYTV